ncbi:MAG TPA: transposase [Vicinamibacterales bacterium]|jgi:REP element-mobilizing transposase RayT
MAPPRLPTHDYSAPSAYLVTIVTHARRAVLGCTSPSTPLVELTEVGELVLRCWLGLPQKFPAVALDVFVVMPNHFHGIVLLNATPDCSSPVSLLAVMHWFKTMTSTGYLNGVREQRWPSVGGHLWQRGYYDRVIRSDSELIAIREYIVGNPGALWERAGRMRRNQIG